MYFPNFYVVYVYRQLLFLRTGCRYTQSPIPLRQHYIAFPRTFCHYDCSLLNKLHLMLTLLTLSASISEYFIIKRRIPSLKNLVYLAFDFCYIVTTTFHYGDLLYYQSEGTYIPSSPSTLSTLIVDKQGRIVSQEYLTIFFLLCINYGYG